MADNEQPPVFELDLGEHGSRLVFKTPDDLAKWSADEFSKWRWLKDAGLPLLEIAWGQHQTLNNRLTEQVEQWRRSIARPVELTHLFNNLKTLIEQHYKDRRILNSTNPAAEFVFQLREKRGDRVAAGAYAVLVDSKIRIGGDTQPEWQLGFVEAFLYKREIDWMAQAHEKALTRLRNQYDADITRQDNRFKELEEKNRVLNDAFNTGLMDKTDALQTLHINQDTEFKKLVTEHAKKIESLEKTYDQTLALQKPVKYWKMKESYHRSRSKWFGGAALGSAVLAGAGLAWLAHWALAGLQPTENPKHWQIGVLLIGAFFTVWLVRVFVRLLFSHLHLATDAAERRMMILTYIAMSRQGTQFADADKKLIIQHIFRSASDGLVKDDAAPPSVFELMTRK